MFLSLYIISFHFILCIFLLIDCYVGAYNGCPLTIKDVKMEDCPTCHISTEALDADCIQRGYGFDPSGRKYAPRYDTKTGVR